MNIEPSHSDLKAPHQLHPEAVHLLNAISDPVFVINRQGIIQFYNVAAMTLFEVSEQQLKGSEIPKLFANEHRNAVQQLVSEASVSLFGRYTPNKPIFRATSTKKRPLEVQLSFNDVAQFPGLRVITMHETLRSGLANDSLEKIELFEKIIKIADIGYFKLDLVTNDLWWSDRIYQIYELPLGSKINLETALSFYNREAKPLIEAAIEHSLETGEPYDLELPFTTAKGNNKWIRTVGYVEYDAAGKPLVLKGAFQDITFMRSNALKAEEGIRAHGQFLANMSHELRTPLNGVLGIAEILGETSLNQSQQEYVSAIKFSASSLMRLVNQVLLYSKVENRPEANAPRRLLIANFLKQVAYSHSLKARKKQIGFNLHIDDSVPNIVMIDADKLEQILHNLFSNAVKFTDKGKISINIYQQDTSLVFKIADTGIGIHSSDMTELFQPFRQTDMSFSRRHHGTGLGLAISRELAHLMDGKIYVSSQPSEGSVFTLQVPFSYVESINPPAIKIEDTATDKQPSISDDDVSLEGKQILIVEDNEINQIIFSEMLAASGARLHIAENGYEALHILNTESDIDIVVMDCQMPEMDGFECTLQIRKDKRFTQLPIIAATAHVFEDERFRCIEVGMDDVIQKPFTKHMLLEIIARYI